MPTTNPLSHSPSLLLAARVFGTIFIGFGINAMVRPASALAPFELDVPIGARELVDKLMVIYGVRDIFMGVAMYAAAAAASTAGAGAGAAGAAAGPRGEGGHARRMLGWIVVAGSGVAFVDGAVCRLGGKGEWNHWGYAPLLTVVGGLLLGVLDRV